MSKLLLAVICFFVGVVVGVFIMCLCAASGNANKKEGLE